MASGSSPERAISVANVSSMPCAASPFRMKLLSELKVWNDWLNCRFGPICENTPPLGASGLTYLK